MSPQLPPPTLAVANATRADRLRLKQARLVLAIGERSPLMQAAAKIYVTQPTATKMLAELEQSLGATLYDRTPRGLVITPVGREVLNFSRKVIVEHDRLLASLAAHAAGTRGEVTIGSFLGAMPDTIAATVLEMKRREPLLTIKLHGETSDHVMQLLESRLVDVAVGRYSAPEQQHSFDHELLGDEALCFVVRAGHPLTERGPLGLADLAEALWVLQPRSTPVRQVLDNEFRRLRLEAPRAPIESSSILTVMQLISRSDAVAMLSEPCVRDYIEAGQLQRLPIEPRASLPGFGLLTRRGDTLDGYAALFRDVIREVVRGRS